MYIPVPSLRYLSSHIILECDVYVPVPSLMYLSSHAILDINTISRELPQNIYDSCGLFSQMLFDFWEGTNFHQYRILLQHPGWYLPHALCWSCVRCAKNFFDFISDGFHLQYFLWWGLAKHESRRWYIIPFIGGNYHHETKLCILNIDQCILFSSSIRGLVPIFSLISFSECFCIFFEFFYVEHSLFP